MMTYNSAKKLAQIIIRVKLGTVSAEERDILGSWLDESEDNRQLYKNIIRWKCIGERLRLEDEINHTTDFKRVLRSVSRRLAHKPVARRVWERISWVSGVAVACCAGIFFTWESMRQPDTPFVPNEQSNVKVEILQPQKGKVMLVLEDGKQIGLGNHATDSIFLSQVTLIGEGNKLSYQLHADSLLRKEIRHTIYTIVGGDYSLVLSDGTRVWLNSQTELQYPVQFVGKERVVRLKGEAYFEVKPDAERPFIVETGEMRTRVLGTSFNISAYANEESVYTTLLSGKVEVGFTGKQEINPVVLQPGMQSQWEKGAGKIMLRKVDPANYVAWRYGVFVFDEDDLDVVTRMLSRWYDVRFVTEGVRAGHHTFSGKMSKDEKLESILKMLTLAGGPEFKIEGNIVRVIEK